ncbi:PREDICTED: selenoprotein M-like [Cyphomyrmex costatus]|uniref:Selenoprotein M n=1 Tax=Cyphomyrmex costatus TaxID=456900 RepID=A0A195BY84_9HYME|nr:PREDICTED: selenoprotein M-like [Cyphomyrmex costatus]KYM93552.1 Selenoprotein M [Cyphomyrmex costatus]
MASIAIVSSFVLMFTLILSIISVVNSTDSYYMSARVESCSGCSLNRLPDVKQFIFEDLPQYDNVEFKHIPGAIPELVLFNSHEEEVERLVLSKLTREECNELLVSKGFTKKFKDNKDEM